MQTIVLVILVAAVSRLPFPDAAFDGVTAIETHYYWPDLVGDLREIMRVLKPGGRLIIVAEGSLGGRSDALLRPVMTALRARAFTRQEYPALLEQAGYIDVSIHEEPSKGWICAAGSRSL